jgi:hypothetical protein
MHDAEGCSCLWRSGHAQGEEDHQDQNSHCARATATPLGVFSTQTGRACVHPELRDG